jgi:Ankyrin repeats (3 copies)
MSLPVTRSYADAARQFQGRPSEEMTSGTLAYSVNRKNSGTSNANENLQRGSIVIEEPIRDASRELTRSRRPSIAEVLGRRLSRSSQASGITTGPSSSHHLPAVQEQENDPSPRTSRRKKKPRPRNRRRRSSKTRDHGDFHAFHTQESIVRPSNVQEKTALEVAISDDDAGRVEELLSDESAVEDTSSSPLQAAALKGNEDILNLLLESNSFEIDARDSRDRTAVYCATSRGHDSIVKILLEQGAKPLSPEEEKIAKLELGKWRVYEAQIKQHDNTASQQAQTFEGAELTSEPEDNSGETLRTLRSPLPTPSRSESKDVDHLYRLIIGSAETIKEKVEEANDERRAAQQRGEWVKGPLPNLPLPNPQKEIGTTQKHVRFPGFGFEIPVVEFDFSPNGGHRIVSPTPSVDELLYGAQGVDTIAKGSGPASLATCRWYHIPANHLGWAEDLIRRIYERRSGDEQRKRDVILGREPFKTVDQDHTNPISLEPRPQSRALRAFCRDMTLDRDGTQRLSSAFTLTIPFVHWETEDNRAEMSHVMETVRRGRKNDLDSLDSPVPLPRSIPDVKAIGEHTDWSKNEKMLCAYLYNQPPVHPRRTLDQFYYHMLEDTKERDQDQVITRYYHNVWKRNQRTPVDEEEFKFAMPTPDEPEFSFRLDNVVVEGPVLDRDAFLKSDDTEELPLPQPADSGLSRQDSNVPSSEMKEPRFVMMVDQLWLWILDDSQLYAPLISLTANHA